MDESESSKCFRHWLGFGAGIGLLLFPSLARWFFLLRASEELVAQFFDHWESRVVFTWMCRGAGVVFIATAVILETRRLVVVRDKSGYPPVDSADAGPDCSGHSAAIDAALVTDA